MFGSISKKDLEESCAMMESQLRTLEKQYEEEKAKSRFLQEQIEALHKDGIVVVNKDGKKFSELDSENKTLRNENKKLKADLKSCTDEKNNLYAQIKALNSQNNQLALQAERLNTNGVNFMINNITQWEYK